METNEKSKPVKPLVMLIVTTLLPLQTTPVQTGELQGDVVVAPKLVHDHIVEIA